jgi:hypothetical protein
VELYLVPIRSTQRRWPIIVEREATCSPDHSSGRDRATIYWNQGLTSTIRDIPLRFPEALFAPGL